VLNNVDLKHDQNYSYYTNYYGYYRPREKDPRSGATSDIAVGGTPNGYSEPDEY
jgi:hypothetical protein